MTENWCSGLDKGIVVLFCTDMFVRKRHLWLFTMIDLLVRGLIPLRKESLAMVLLVRVLCCIGTSRAALWWPQKHQLQVEYWLCIWYTSRIANPRPTSFSAASVGKPCGLINDFDDMIWYCHDVPDHSKCRSSMLNLLQQLEKEGVGDVATPPVPQHASSNDDLPGHQEPPYDEATIVWMLGRILQRSNFFSQQISKMNDNKNWLNLPKRNRLTKIHAENKTSTREDIQWFQKKLLVPNAAALGKNPPDVSSPNAPKWFRCQELSHPKIQLSWILFLQ